MPEICNNSIDDDGDGLIDLNDLEDCPCSIVAPVSIIENSSFEQIDCCPSNAQLDCLSSWEQASAANIRYYHTCAEENLLIPVPFPDGDGVIGIINGRPNDINNYKEYIGTCLTEPLVEGVKYKFRFDIGFPVNLTAVPIAVTLFGTVDCDNLPFGGDDELIGCPTNTLNWTSLGQVGITEGPGWQQLEIEFTAPFDINTIALGPPCEPIDLLGLDLTAYYFFDNLILDDALNFSFSIEPSGSPCDPDLTFKISDNVDFTYQWFKDGIALVDERESRIQVRYGEGTYQVQYDDGIECRLTEGYDHILPLIETNLIDSICQGEVYRFGNQNIVAPGIYQEIFKNVDNCDSIVQLEIFPTTIQAQNVSAKIFPNESYEIGGFRIGEIGDHQITLKSAEGCDTIISLNLAYYNIYIPNAFSPNDDGINDSFIISGDEDLITVSSLQIFDRWGGEVYNRENLTPNARDMGWDGSWNGQTMPNGTFVYSTTLLMDDGKERRISGSVTLLR